MSSQSYKANEASSSTFSTPSILRPSILPDGLKASDVQIENSNTGAQTRMPSSLVKAPDFSPKTPAPVSTEPTSTPGFVFGQNMSSRVVNANQGASRNIWQAFGSNDHSDE